MEAFAKQYGFQFRCHEKGHSNRKAGEERSFWTVETNFLAGRSFLNFNDLNRQALEWATVRMEHRPQGKAKLIPAKAFEHERRYLAQLPAHLPAPYHVHERGADQYGFAAFDGNYYWVPGTERQEVKILQYSDRLKIYLARECLAEYPLPADGVSNQHFSPPELPAPPCQPKNRRYPSAEEEKRLRALDPEVSRYLDFVLQSKEVHQRHHFLRQLLALSQTMTPELFVKSVQRAHRYRINSLQTIERIALLSRRLYHLSCKPMPYGRSSRCVAGRRRRERLVGQPIESSGGHACLYAQQGGAASIGDVPWRAHVSLGNCPSFAKIESANEEADARSLDGVPNRSSSREGN